MPNWTGILITLLCAFVLTLLPMPGWTMWIRPAWVLMVLVYWTMIAPAKVNLGTAWLSGLLLDLLTGTLLGEHALGFIIVIYLVNRMHIRLALAPLFQQAITVAFLVWLNLFILYFIQGVIGNLPTRHLYWLSPFSSLLIWPFLVILMRESQKWFKIA